MLKSAREEKKTEGIESVREGERVGKEVRSTEKGGRGMRKGGKRGRGSML